MANPQDPGLRRSENVPALHPDAMEAELEARDRPEVSTPPLAEPDQSEGDVQDKPPLDDVAETLGTVKPDGQ